MGYQAKDHFHTPRKYRTKSRPSEKDLLEEEQPELEEKFRYKRPEKKHSNERE